MIIAGNEVNDAGMCSCGKIRYASRQAARAVITAKGWTTLHVYECLGYFHIGHRPRGMPKRHRKKQR